MSISNNAFHNDATIQTETSYPRFRLLSYEPEVVIEKPPSGDLQLDSLSVNYTQENGFTKGFLIALPISFFLWVIIGWGIKSLFF